MITKLRKLKAINFLHHGFHLCQKKIASSEGKFNIMGGLGLHPIIYWILLQTNSINLPLHSVLLYWILRKNKKYIYLSIPFRPTCVMWRRRNHMARCGLQLPRHEALVFLPRVHFLWIRWVIHIQEELTFLVLSSHRPSVHLWNSLPP